MLGPPGDGGLSLQKFRSVVALYQFELDAPQGEGSPKSYHTWALQAFKKRFFWPLTVLGAPGDGGLSLQKFRSVVALYQFELDAPRGKGSPKSYHSWALQAFKKRFFWPLTVLGPPGDGGLSLQKFRSVVALCQFELDAPQRKGSPKSYDSLGTASLQ